MCLPGSISIHYKLHYLPRLLWNAQWRAWVFLFLVLNHQSYFFSHALQQREQTEYWNWYLIGWQVFLDKDILPKFENFLNIGQYASQKLYLTETYRKSWYFKGVTFIPRNLRFIWWWFIVHLNSIYIMSILFAFSVTELAFYNKITIQIYALELWMQKMMILAD